ncbi:MAG: hypothetical protein NVSMB2_00560 [Chloroflexota bacterium]
MRDTADVTLRGRFEVADEKRYRHVPFVVPSGVRALHVSYDYTDRIPSDPLLSGGNTLDIGLFDPRGIGESSPGFRGWSGSNKLSFSVTDVWATPPYMRGPISPGTWHVLLGPYKVGPRGCEYEVRVQWSAHVEPDAGHSLRVRAERPRPARSGVPGWLPGDLHCHTLYSDGDSWPAEMMVRAIERGLDFLGVTDHNQVGHQSEYAQLEGADLPIVLPGVEVTTYGGHWNAWGTDRWWDFRAPDRDATETAMRAALASGAVVSVNHPKPFGPAWEYGTLATYHAVEVWNGDWNRFNAVALGWWEDQLCAGRRLVALGGSDTHYLRSTDPDPRHARDLGMPTTWVRAGSQPSALLILDALRGGDVYLSRSPHGPHVFLQRQGGTVRIRALEARGATLQLIAGGATVWARGVDRDDWADTLADDCAWSYVRAQVLDSRGEMLALGNPCW